MTKLLSFTLFAVLAVALAKRPAQEILADLNMNIRIIDDIVDGEKITGGVLPAQDDLYKSMIFKTSEVMNSSDEKFLSFDDSDKEAAVMDYVQDKESSPAVSEDKKAEEPAPQTTGWFSGLKSYFW